MPQGKSAKDWEHFNSLWSGGAPSYCAATPLQVCKVTSKQA